MGSIVTNPPSVPNTEVDSWAPLVVRDAMSYYGLNKITLTNWDETTTLPQIAQGSLIDIDGSLAQFIVDEVIGGAPSDGTVYLYFAVAGDTVTPTLTNTAPEWYADKGGWYNALGERYSGHLMTKAGALYTEKVLSLTPGVGIAGNGGVLSSGITTDNLALKTKYFSGTLDASGDAYITTEILNLSIVFVSATVSVELQAGVWDVGGTTDASAQFTLYDETASFNQSQLRVLGGTANARYRATVTYMGS